MNHWTLRCGHGVVLARHCPACATAAAGDAVRLAEIGLASSEYQRDRRLALGADPEDHPQDHYVHAAMARLDAARHDYAAACAAWNAWDNAGRPGAAV